MAECCVCSSGYKYGIVARDANEDVRIYVLAPIGNDVFVSIVNTLSRLGTPQWPVWVPRWEFHSRELQESINTSLETLLASAGEERLVISTEDLSKTIIACKSLDEPSRTRISYVRDLNDPEIRNYRFSYIET